MTVEIRPFGTRCNIQCRYCYQQPRRDAGHIAKEFDLDKIKEAVLAEGDAFSLFGGEPLMVRIADLEALWSWGFERFGKNSVQTNGTLIRDAHIALFKRYNVSVGISIDGPGEMNDIRWAGRLDSTRALTARTEAAMPACQSSSGTRVTASSGAASGTGGWVARAAAAASSTGSGPLIRVVFRVATNGKPRTPTGAS